MIERVSGYLQTDSLGVVGKLSVGIESRKLNACIKQTNKLCANGVFGAPCWGFYEDNLDFLTHLERLESIWFWDVELTNIDGIYALTNLKSFGVDGKRPGIDFGKLKSLKSVVWTYNRRDTGLDKLRKLKLLHIWRFNPKTKSFAELDCPDTISEFQINWSNVTDLQGLPVMPKLRKLEIQYCRNLQSIAELRKIAPNLSHLVVDACGRVTDGEKVVKRFSKLNHAFINKKHLV